MGGLLRKKNKQQQLKPVLPPPPASNVTTTTTVTPLFARFATTAKEVPDKPRLVSSPMVLARSVPSKGAVAQATMYQPMQQRREGNVRPGSREALPTTPVAGPGRGTGGLATATQRPQGVEGPLASEHRTPSIHGEYAHLWSMIVGADGASSSPPEQARRSTEYQNIGSESTGSASRVLGSAASSTASNPNLHLHPNFPSSPPPIAPPHTSTPKSTSSDPDVDHPHSDRPSSSSRYTSSTLGEPGTTATSLSRDPWNDVQASVSASFSSSSSHPAAHFVPHPSYENVSSNVSANATDRNNDIQVMPQPYPHTYDTAPSRKLSKGHSVRSPSPLVRSNHPQSNGKPDPNTTTTTIIGAPDASAHLHHTLSNPHPNHKYGNGGYKDSQHNPSRAPPTAYVGPPYTHQHQNQHEQQQQKMSGHYRPAGPAVPVPAPQTPRKSSNSSGRGHGVGSVDGHSSVDGHANGHANGCANGHANGHPNRHANGHANGHANRHANGHANGLAPGGKPLIFAAMAAVDQEQGESVVQYKSCVGVGGQEQQVEQQQPVQQGQQHLGNALPPRRESLLRHAHTPAQSQSTPLKPSTPPQPVGRAASFVGIASHHDHAHVNGSGSGNGIHINGNSNGLYMNGIGYAKGLPSAPPTPIEPKIEPKSPTSAPLRTRRPSKSARPSIDHSQKALSSAPASISSPSKPESLQIDGGDTLGVPLDDDPFAKVEGVRMLAVPGAATANSSPNVNVNSASASVSASSRPSTPERQRKSVFGSSRPGSRANLRPSTSASASVSVLGSGSVSPSTMSSDDDMRRANANADALGKPDAHAHAHADLPIHAPPTIPGNPDGADYLTSFLSLPRLLGTLLEFFTFYEWCLVLSLSREIRFMIVQSPELRETVLERFLKTVGYRRWVRLGAVGTGAGGGEEADPLSLSLQDLSDYMRGVSTPTHEYARIAALYNHSLYVHPSHRDPSLYETVRLLAASCRAYSRVVLRLRAQAEKEVAVARSRAGRGGASRPPSRVPSPTFSYSNQSHASSAQNSGSNSNLNANSQQHQNQLTPAPASAPAQRPTFSSPLFRPKRAPLLRVFVPSPDGDWLSDKSVLECEAECRRAGVNGLMRLGDVVWDVAVGDEGNVGRLVWDGSYLIDLDYTYSPIGDLPKYMPTLAFPPSYFHRVIRTGPSASNPIAHIDLRPWGEEIAANLQLLQDRVRTETPQGTYHNVVRWVHRSSFVIRPPPRGPQRSPRVPIPEIPEYGLFVDSGWYGTIVVETEGTNESLADLQDRCGPGAFPPRPTPVNGVKATDREGKLVFRILREKSRPGEIWIRAVSPKEKLL